MGEFKYLSSASMSKKSQNSRFWTISPKYQLQLSVCDFIMPTWPEGREILPVMLLFMWVVLTVA